MGSERIADSLPENKLPLSHTPYTDVFREQFAYYLSIGMPYDLYWNGDCTLVKDYRKADQLRLERDNTHFWLQGMYFYEALCDVAPILVSFPKKGAKVESYTKQPYPVTREAHERKMEAERNARLEKLKARLIRASKEKH